MRKMFNLLIIFLLLSVACNAQQECGTKAYSGNDTAILNRLAEQERKTQEWINTSPESRAKYYKIEYPSIPGFTPTGDYYKDAANYAEAKKRFYETDPIGYKKWNDALIAENTPPNLTEEEQKRVAEKIKNRKQ